MATNPAAKVLRFSPDQKSDEWLLANAFEHAPNGMALLDSDGRITHTSTVFCDILGFARAELLGLGLSEITHSDDVETEAEQRKRLARGEIDRYRLVQRFVRGDGSPNWVLLSVAACRRSSGFPEYYVLQIESDSKQCSIADDGPPDALEYLLGEAVHEIGNTLTPLMVNTQLILERSSATDIRDCANVIFRAARRIAFTLRRLRGLNDFHSVAYLGDERMLDLRSVPPFTDADAQ